LHRWRVVSRPTWILSQSWNWLLFAHWPVDPRALRSLVPPEFDLDLFAGRAWLAVVVSHVTNVAAPGLPPLPFVSAFDELNCGTFVRVNGRPGVYFFSVDAGSSIAAAAGRTFFNLPYHDAAISVRRDCDGVDYIGERLDGTASFRIAGCPAAAAHMPTSGSLAFFLTERLSLFHIDACGQPYRIDVQRPRWRLRGARGVVAIDGLVRASCIPAPAAPPMLHFVDRGDMVASAPQPIR